VIPQPSPHIRKWLIEFYSVAIVKIQARFEGKGKPVWMMGTGWLIRPDVLVTAGHVVYDWGRRYGAASQIRCFIGYNGRASLQTSQVQARYGVKVVSTEEWLQDAGNRTRDLAFIQVDRAFTGNLRTFNYVNTPPSGHKTILGVVGYPGDKSLKDPDTGDEEKGAQMYEEYAKNDYDIAESPRHMVEYQISTFGGKMNNCISRKPPKFMLTLVRAVWCPNPSKGQRTVGLHWNPLLWRWWY
jgi:V8-like Glu-specific endopeptidase